MCKLRRITHKLDLKPSGGGGGNVKFLAWAWLAKPKAKEVIPKFQPLPKHLRKTPSKRKERKKETSLENKNRCIFRLDIIIRYKFTTNFDRCAMLIVRNCLTKNFEL